MLRSVARFLVIYSRCQTLSDLSQTGSHCTDPIQASIYKLRPWSWHGRYPDRLKWGSGATLEDEGSCSGLMEDWAARTAGKHGIAEGCPSTEGR